MPHLYYLYLSQLQRSLRMTKNALPTLPTIATKKHEIIIELNDKDMFFNIQKKSIQEIIDSINMVTRQTLDISIREAK